MRYVVTVIDLHRAHSGDVVVDATPDTTVDALARELGDGVRTPAVYVDGRAVDPWLPLAAAPIRDGTVLSLDDPAGCPPRPSAGAVELRVTGGCQSGAVHRLMPGTFVVGSGPRATVRVADPHLPSDAFTLAVGADGSCQVRLLPGCQARVDGEPLRDGAALREGAQLAAGGSLFEVAMPTRPDAVLAVSADSAGLDYNRRPRVRPRRPHAVFQLPQPPRRGDSGPLPIITTLVPVLLAVGTAVMFRQWAYLLIGLLSPVGMLVQHQAERRRGRKSFRRQVEEHRAERERVMAAARQAFAAERALRRSDGPDPAWVLITATGPRSRMWERRRGDEDFLAVRVGTGEVAAQMRLEDPEQPGGGPASTLADAAVVLPLPEYGVLGVAGAGELSRALGRWIVAQVATLHSPRDVRICVLTAPQGQASWRWVRWLPHARAEGTVLIGNDDESVRRRVGQLTALLDGPKDGPAPMDGRRDRPALLLVLDGARRLRSVPGVVRLLDEGPAAGVYAVCLDSDERRLPAECGAVIVADGASVRVHRSGADALAQVRPDLVDAGWCERLARAMAPVRDVSDGGTAAGPPDSARLLPLLGLDPPAGPAIAAAWRARVRSTSAVIGVSADGPFTVDLRRDGPHGLVAGTTGAGKSELLQTLIAALAVANRPDEMTFVLIDYKGGSAFRECARLPHTVGLVTDLDGHLTERALESLGAELRRRERLLLRAGAKDIEDYADLRDGGAGLEALPRLVIVIDEFASLVAELPDFVAGLVDIARRGRSLGVHLILATQRPAGVVTADIRANTNLRIALRVTDVAESSDVIDAPDAAGIARSTPGRCYVRAGASSLAGVQAARVGGRRPARASKTAPPPQVVPVPWSRLGSGLPEVGTEPDDADMVTDLAVLVEAVREAGAGLDIPSRPGPWLAPLPDAVTLDELPPCETVPFGLTDLPAAQAREALAVNVVHGGHLAIVGAARSGRSTALRTIAGSLAARTQPTDAHLYAIDCGANALLPLVSLPHCGAVVGRDQVDRMERLVARLQAEVSRRQQVLAAGGFAGLAEQRAAAPPPERLPWLVLLLDRWDGFVAAYEHYDFGRLVDAVVAVLREGPAVGLRAVVTGDRSVLSGHVSTVFERRLVLRMADPADYGYADISPRQVPSAMPPGRALEPGATVRESQIALLDADRSGTAQVAALSRIAGWCQRPPAGPLRPMRVDDLPVRVTAAEAQRLGPVPDTPLWTLVGAGGDELGPVGVDLLADGPGFTVAGPARSGRSTVLLTMARFLLARSVPVVVVTPRRSPLRELAGVNTVEDPAGVASATAGHSRYVVVVDDAELLRDTELDAALAEVVRAARDGEHAVVIAGTTEDLKSAYRGFIADTLRSRSGLLLDVRTADDGDILGLRLPRNAAGGGPAGRGLLVRLGTARPVQVALPG